MGEAAALAHGVVAGGDGDEGDAPLGVGHRQTVFLGWGVDNGDVVPCGSLDDADEVPQWAIAEMMMLAELLGLLTPENLGAHHQRTRGIAWSAR